MVDAVVLVVVTVLVTVVSGTVVVVVRPDVLVVDALVGMFFGPMIHVRYSWSDRSALCTTSGFVHRWPSSPEIFNRVSLKAKPGYRRYHSMTPPLPLLIDKLGHPSREEYDIIQTTYLSRRRYHIVERVPIRHHYD